MSNSPERVIGGVALQDCLAECRWGRVWRGQADGEWRLVLLYSAEALPLSPDERAALEAWQRVGGTDAAPMLARILDIGEGPEPYLVLGDPGGKTVRAEFPPGRHGLVDRMRAARDIAKACVIAAAHGVPLAAVTPDSVVGSGSPDAEAHWVLLPVGLQAPATVELACDGRYLAPSLPQEPDAWRDFHPASYAAGWLAVELAASDWGLPREPARLPEWVRWKRLRTLLGNALLPSQGHFGDPRLLQLGLDHWLKYDSSEDLREADREERAGRLPPWRIWLEDNRLLLVQGGIAGAVLLFLIGMFLIGPRLFVAENTNRTPYGVTNLFWEAMIDGDVDQAQEFTIDSATAQAPALLAAIRRMEEQNLASRFTSAVPQVRGAGQTRTVAVDLRGEAGDVFMRAEMVLRGNSMGEWEVQQLLFEPLREAGD